MRSRPPPQDVVAPHPDDLTTKGAEARMTLPRMDLIENQVRADFEPQSPDAPLPVINLNCDLRILKRI